MNTKRSEVATIAQLVRDGKMGAIEGARKLNSLRHEIPQKDFDDDFILFVAIDSETDHLPAGEVRKHYSPEALQKADTEIQNAEKYYRPQVVVACEKLIAKFSNIT